MSQAPTRGKPRWSVGAVAQLPVLTAALAALLMAIVRETPPLPAGGASSGSPVAKPPHVPPPNSRLLPALVTPAQFPPVVWLAMIVDCAERTPSDPDALSTAAPSDVELAETVVLRSVTLAPEVKLIAAAS